MTAAWRIRLSWVYWCFTSHATILQSYMWRHRCAGGLKKKLYLQSGSQRHRHFAGFFIVSVLHRHGTTLFYGDSDTPPHLVAFYNTLRIRRTYARLKPPASSRGEELDRVNSVLWQKSLRQGFHCENLSKLSRAIPPKDQCWLATLRQTRISPKVGFWIDIHERRKKLIHVIKNSVRFHGNGVWMCDVWAMGGLPQRVIRTSLPREDAGGLSREYVLRIPSVS